MQCTSGFLGLFFAAAVLYLLRRDHIKISHALFWIVFAMGGLVFGFFPRLSDDIARLFGVSYGPMLVVVIALVALVLRSVSAEMSANGR